MVRIVEWDSLRHIKFPNILLGNGFSQCFSTDFGYTSLKEYGVNEGIITPSVESIFRKFGTVNFEEVLDRLNTSEKVLMALQEDPATIVRIQQNHYETKDALINIIHEIHPIHADLTDRLDNLNNHFRSYYNVFTTNYDLLLYWSIMRNETGFKDLFWNQQVTFDYADTEVVGEATLIYYIHGALHLFRNEQNEIRKILAGGTNLQTSINQQIQNDQLPLFISEGDYLKKVQKIRSSDYLMHCLNSLRYSAGNLLIFGHSLEPQFDQHILNAIKNIHKEQGNDFEVAVSVYDNDQDAAMAINYNLDQYVSPNLRRHFFESTTHPISQV